MKNLFSYESPVAQVLYKICCACCLSMIWLVCSLPIFTMGAATTALYAVSIKLIRETEGTSIVRQFWGAFRENFRQATQLWLILLAAGSFLAVDGYVLFHLRQTATGFPAIFWTLLFAVIIAAAIVYAIVLAYTFPLLSYFENTNRAMLVNAFLVGIRYLFCTILILAVHIAVAWVTINLFAPLLMFGEGLCALVSAHFLSDVFRSISGEKEAEALSESDEEEL